jgi:hypothetical protein
MSQSDLPLVIDDPIPSPAQDAEKQAISGDRPHYEWGPVLRLRATERRPHLVLSDARGYGFLALS